MNQKIREHLFEKKIMVSPQEKTKEKIFNRAIELYLEGIDIEECMNTLQTEFGKYADLWDIASLAAVDVNMMDMNSKYNQDNN